MQPDDTPTHQQHQQPPQAAPQPYPTPVGYQQTTVATAGIPTWVHLVYLIGGFFTCGLLWLVWIAH